MAKRIYRTNRGKAIDIEAMRQANEKTVAAGNMSVNAKGDVVKGGKVVTSAKSRVEPHYKKTTQVAKASLKKPLTKEEKKVEPTDKPKPEPVKSEMTTETIRTREDGSTYKEIIQPDGDIKIEDIEPKPKKKTKKKSTSKKKPTI